MKKILPALLIIFIMMISLTSCKGIKALKEHFSATETDATQEVQTAVGTSVEYVTDENGEAVTGENGEQLTELHFVDVTVDSNSTAPDSTAVSTTAADNQPTETTTAQPATTAPSTTVSSGNTDVTAPATTVPATQPSSQGDIPANSEYEILRSGNFYALGNITDEKGVTMPMEMAVTKDSLYMTYASKTHNMVALIDAKNNVYLILPDDKVYLQISSSMLNVMGSSVEDMTGNNIDFSELPALSEATEINDTKMNGIACKEYVLHSENGIKRVYLNGNKIVAYASYSKSDKLHELFVIDSITGTVPASKTTPPSGYKVYKDMIGMLSFMSKYEDLFDE